MKRYALEQLVAWSRKENGRRKPLILTGARQVGKTWLMRELARAAGMKEAYVNLMDTPVAIRAFEGTLNVQDILVALSAACGTEITPGDTLIILDEIQESERVLNALKFLRENAPQYHIVAAGSLLGVAIRKRRMSFPVGQVEFFKLHPLGFCEFLEAIGQERLARVLSERNMPLIDTLSEVYERYLRQYLCVGGMPEAVAAYAPSGDFSAARAAHRNILDSYEADFSKYTEAANILRIRAVWQSLPRQLAAENQKFTYNRVAKGARGREYDAAIDWLHTCGLVHKVRRISKPSLPLKAYLDESAFKLYMLDCGLMCTMAGLDPATVLEGDGLFSEFKGALTEQYVLQTLKLRDDLPLGYWANTTGAAEVDFVVQHAGQNIPLEVKSGTNLKSKSLAAYRAKFNQRLAVRTSLAHFGEVDGLWSIPLYAMEQICTYLAGRP